MKVKMISVTFALLGIVCVAGISLNAKGFSINLSTPEQLNIRQTPQPSATQIPETAETIMVSTPSAEIAINPQLTPGDIIKDLPLDLLCMTGYTKTVRDVSKTTKKNVYELYDISYPPPEGEYVIDHLIPLELGGSNSIKNLWPQRAASLDGSKEKDKAEHILHDMVCQGTMQLPDAQYIISHDYDAWYERNIVD